MTTPLRGHPVLAAMLDDDSGFPPNTVAQIGSRSGMARSTAMATTFQHFYGKVADRIIVGEDTDFPSLLAGNPYHFDRVIPHVRRLFLAYIRAFAVWCDRINGFRDPPLPWTHPTRFQLRWYYRQKGWNGPVDWAQQNVEIAHKKYIRAVKRLTPGRRAHWERILVAWRTAHDRNLPTSR